MAEGDPDVGQSAELGGRSPLLLRPLRPVPRRSPRPWAGRRLGAGDGIGELWVADPAAVVDVEGVGAVTLDDLAALGREAFVGRRALRRLGPRFPLLVKLIDAAEWLSLQVHPDDALAAELYGHGALGKVEAWLVVEADPETSLVTGPREGLGEAALRTAIEAGTLGRGDCVERPAIPGETLLIPAGTIHAIGAGALVYEIEQPSDLTFRISDWGRPATPDRPLHRAESLRAVDPAGRAVPVGSGWRLDGGALEVPQFRLELAAVPDPVARRPAGETLHVVTAVLGTAVVQGEGWSEALAPFETLVVPASVPSYRIGGPPGGLACVGSVP